MSEEVNFPTETHEELSSKHLLCEEEAVDKFLGMCFHHNNKEYFNQLKVRLELEVSGIS